MRDLLLAELEAVLGQCSHNEPGAALDPNVLALAAMLIDGLVAPEDDLEVARAVPELVRQYFQAGELSTAGGLPDQDHGAQASSARGLNLLKSALSTGQLAELDQAVALLRDSVAASDPDDAGLAGRLSNLCYALRLRFERTMRPDDVDAAVDAGRAAVAKVPAGHPDRVASLTNLSAALVASFLYHGAMPDLDAAIAAGREAVAEIRADSDRAASLTNLSAALRVRHEQTASAADLTEAIAAAQEAIRLRPSGDPRQAASLSVLCNCLRSRFESTGDRSDLDAAIAAGRAAANAIADGHPDLGKVLSNLATALTSRFEQTADPADLDQAITVGTDALATVGADDSARASMLLNLGSALAARFGHGGELADLEAAVTRMEEGIEAAPPGHPGLVTMRHNLAMALRMRYERTEARADLEAAVTAARRAVDDSAAGYPNRPAMLSSLGAALRIRSFVTENLADLDEAVAVSQQALAELSRGHPDHGAVSSNLGAALLVRHGRTGSPADQDAAIAAFEAAIASTAADQPGRAMMLTNLGDSLSDRFEETSEAADLAAAITAWRQAAAITSAAPVVRAAAARRWGWAAGVLEDWPESVRGFETAASLIGLVTPRGIARRDHEHLLAGLDGMAGQAAGCCVRAGQPDRAVELLEQTRGVLLGQALDTRTDLTELAALHPDLASRFVRLRDDLGRLDAADGLLPALQSASGKAGRSELALAFDRLLAEIRAKPDFAAFLRPMPVRELAAAAAAGPVVIVNASRFGSHALILTSEGLLAPLKLDFDPDQLIDQVAIFAAVVGGEVGSAPAQEELAGVLGWLWDTIAGPVLDYLGITRPPELGAAWPRLWWCAPGLLSFLPLHAAGHHQTRSALRPKTVADRVISSYTPTVRALIHARGATAADRQASTEPPAPPDLAVVAMPHTPGASDLRGALAEAELLAELFGDRTNTFVGAEASFGSVTRAMSAARWAHFACHGATDAASPSDSLLLLHDYRRQPLTVTEVARLRLTDAEFAFLSACTTARPDEQVTDEAIHLASAFQLAGYRHVIGTLWPINDRIAVKIATTVYQRLASTGAAGAAAALHAAIRQVRDERHDDPSLWAAHIHVGP